jgi:hypothetical protein
MNLLTALHAHAVHSTVGAALGHEVARRADTDVGGLQRPSDVLPQATAAPRQRGRARDGVRWRREPAALCDPGWLPGQAELGEGARRGLAGCASWRAPAAGAAGHTCAACGRAGTARATRGSMASRAAHERRCAACRAAQTSRWSARPPWGPLARRPRAAGPRPSSLSWQQTGTTSRRARPARPRTAAHVPPPSGHDHHARAGRLAARLPPARPVLRASARCCGGCGAGSAQR